MAGVGAMAEVIDPNARIADLIGLLYVLDNVFDGKGDMYRLEKEMEVDVDNLMPIVYTANRLGLVVLESGDLTATPLGKEFIKSSVKQRKEILRERIKTLEPFVTALRMNEFEIDGFMEELETSGVQTFNSPTGHHDVEVMLIEWGVYSGLLRKEDDVYIINNGK